MNRITGYLLLFFLMLLFHSGFAQIKDEQKEREMEQAIEGIAESDEVDIDNSVLLEDLTANAEQPVNINLANEEELTRLNLLDFNQIQNLIKYRQKYGLVVSNYELAAIEGFNPEIGTTLSPFITYEVPTDSISIQKRRRNYLISRIKASFPQAKGYRAVSDVKGAAYPGLPLSLYTRYHLEIPRKIECGLITDNDAGEQFFRGSNKLGFDYYSGFISCKGEGFIRQVTLGDFQLKVGQGVSFGGGVGLGKSGNTMGILKFGQTVRPYTSTDENRFFRGVSTIFGYGPLKLVLFYSNKNRDANILKESMTGSRYFTSLQTSGYHRTSSEIEDEKSLNEQITGGYGELRLSRFRVGGLMVLQQFNLPMSTGSSSYKSRNFEGRNNLNLGVDYQLALHHFQIFGEAGLSGNGRGGGVQGVIWHASPRLCLSTYFRCFDPGFHTFYGSSLSESSGNHNETGLYTGVLINPLPRVKIFGYIDFYHFPWLTYTTIAPSSGSDYMAQVDVALTRKFSFYLKGKYETKPQKTSASEGISVDYDEVTTKLRVQTEYMVSDKVSLRARFEYAGYHFNKTNERGFLLFQDIVFAPFRKIKIWLRYSLFNTEGYNSRIYSYENDLLYSFSIPEFHGTGQRFYINLKWSPSSRVTLYLKSGCTIHDGASSWGSGNDVTNGNKRTELRGLVNWRF